MRNTLKETTPTSRELPLHPIGRIAIHSSASLETNPLLDEIETILEEDAEAFVQAFTQAPGQ